MIFQLKLRSQWWEGVIYFFQTGTQQLKGVRLQTQPPDYAHTDSTIPLNTLTGCSFSDAKVFLPFLHKNINLQMFHLKPSFIGIPEVNSRGSPSVCVERWKKMWQWVYGSCSLTLCCVMTCAKHLIRTMCFLFVKISWDEGSFDHSYFTENKAESRVIWLGLQTLISIWYTEPQVLNLSTMIKHHHYINTWSTVFTYKVFPSLEPEMLAGEVWDDFFLAHRKTLGTEELTVGKECLGHYKYWLM